MAIVYGIGLLVGLFIVNVAFARVLRAVLGPGRYEAFTYSPATAASVGVNYHRLRFFNAALLAGIGVLAALLWPAYAKVFGVVCGLSIALFTGYFFGGLVVAAVIGLLF